MPKSYDYKLEGLTKVLNNLNDEIGKIKNKSGEGVMKAALLVERDSKKKTPVDTGNLKAGTYVQPVKTRKGNGAEIGYTANYAIHVHERKELIHPVGQYKFLEAALNEDERKILEIIKNESEVG